MRVADTADLANDRAGLAQHRRQPTQAQKLRLQRRDCSARQAFRDTNRQPDSVRLALQIPFEIVITVAPTVRCFVRARPRPQI
jgi:hypothetical protein